MQLAEFFSAQLERESAVSARVLARVVEGRQEWKPHDKSMPLGYLATLVATMPSWITMAVRQDELDLAPASGAGYRPPDWSTNDALRAIHERCVLEARHALRDATEAHLAKPWRLLVTGRTVSEDPRHVVIADVFTHLAHHRGQLTVYLRLLGIPVPSVYGPSADDRAF